MGDYHSTDRSIIFRNGSFGQGRNTGSSCRRQSAPLIEHTVSLAGTPSGTFLPNAYNEALHYLIDGNPSPNLIFRRGEVHRFHFDATTKDFPLSFLTHPEYEMPTVSLKCWSLHESIIKAKLSEPAGWSASGGSAFANYLSHEIGTIADCKRA